VARSTLAASRAAFSTSSLALHAAAFSAFSFPFCSFLRADLVRDLPSGLRRRSVRNDGRTHGGVPEEGHPGTHPRGTSSAGFFSTLGATVCSEVNMIGAEGIVFVSGSGCWLQKSLNV